MAKESDGGILEEEEYCPTCKRLMKKDIEPNGQGGFFYTFKCARHGLIEKRHPTIRVIESFNQ